MSAARTCPQCGAELSDNALEGLCQDCLGKLALGDGQSKIEKRFGDYELIEEIAHGGMGVVYKARQLSLNRTVAVKMIRAGPFASKEFVHRFRVEASAAAVLQHPNIVAVHEVGVHEGQHFFSMDFVAGKNLAQIVRDGPLPPNRAARYVQKIAEAIHYAHQSGILHRDLKPSNVLIDQNDQPRITDFGLAKQLNSESSATLTGEVMGTPGYMPPEQASGNRGAVKAWSDVYSLGAVLYHLLTGRAPFAAGSLEETLNQVLHRDPISVRLLTPGVPRDLDTICLKCLEKEPAKRYASAQMLAEELTRFLNHEPILARPMSAAGKAWRWCRRKPALAAALATVVSLLGAVAFISTFSAVRQRELRQHAEVSSAQAQATVTRLEIDRAEMLFANDQSAEALAYLARVVRREPTNRVAGERILSALANRNFCLPLFRLELKGTATAAEFSPDGQRVLTVSKEGGAQIWDGRTGQSMLGPLGHGDEVTAAHYSPDGTRLVTAALDKTARVWDARSGLPVTDSLPHDSGVLCADFSPDGQRVVTGSADGSVRWWNASTGMPLGTPLALSGGVDFVKFSPNGKSIALASTNSRSGRLIDATEGTELAAFGQKYLVGAPGAFPSFSPDGERVITVPMDGTLKVIGRAAQPAKDLGTAPFTCVRFSPDGHTLATSVFDSTARFWDADTFQPIGPVIRHGNRVNSIEFSPDGRQVVTGCKDHTARIWEAGTGLPVSEPLQHDASVLSVQFSPDGQRILSRCEGSSVWVWEVRRGLPLTASLPHAGEVHKAVFSPDGGRVACAPWNGESSLWETRRATLLHPLGRGAADIQFSRDGHRLLTAGREGATTIWDPGTGQMVGGPFLHNQTWNDTMCARFSPDGQLVLMAGWGNRVRVWQIATGNVVAEFLHQANTACAQFSPNGQRVITTSADQTACLWDLGTGKLLTKALRHDGPVVWADFSPDGERVATLSKDKTARIWETRSGRLLHPPLLHSQEPYYKNSVQFSPGGQRVVTATENAAQVWNGHTGQPVTVPLKHDGRVNSVRFSPDGKRLLTACSDGAARVWDVASGHLLGEPMRHRDRVHYAEFSADGHWIITASVDRTARIWEVPTLTSAVPSWLADLAEAVAGRRIDARNAGQFVPFEELQRMRQSLEKTSDGDEAARWARWFFADSSQRTISPGSAITVAQWVKQRIEQGSFESLEEAVRSCPSGALAQARLALVSLTNEATPSPGQLAGADWQSLRSLALAPEDPEVLCARAEVCERLGRISEAWQLLERASPQPSAHPTFWQLKGRLLEQTNRLEEAYQSYSQALGLAGTNGAFLKVRGDVLLRRSNLLRRLNRAGESKADYEKYVETVFSAARCNDLATNSVAGPPEARDPERAVLLARRADRLHPKFWSYVHTLGVAYYRAGQYRQALEALLEARQLDPDGVAAYDLFFLAMAHQQLGESAAARTCFDQAMQWWRDHPHPPPHVALVLQSFQAEAEALLSQKKQP